MDAVSVRSLTFIDSQLKARGVTNISLLPKDVRKEIKKEARKIARQDVFGAEHKTDKAGEPIEMGVGSPGNMTQQNIDAYVKAQTDKKLREAPEQGYEENLKRMKAQLAECNARRRAERDEDEDDD